MVRYLEDTGDSDITIAFDYPASDPAGVTIDGSKYEPASGYIRVWTKDGSAARSPISASAPATPGDYVPPGSHTPEALSTSEGQITLYVEGISLQQGQSLPISVQFEKDGNPINEDLVYVRTYELEYLAFDDETGEVYPAESVTGPSNLTPDLSIQIVDSRLTMAGMLEVDIEGHVKDRLSELADDPAQRLQAVNFYVNGEYHSAITNLPAMSPGSGVLPWQPHLLDVNFSTTLTIDSGQGFVRPGGYVIQALTSPNAAGRTAKDTTHLTVQWHILEDLFQTSTVTGTAGLTMSFPAVPSDTEADWAWVYFGDREPWPTDGQVSEPTQQPDSLAFEGNLLLEDDGESIAIPLTVQIDDTVNFTSDEIDSFEATVTYEFEDENTYTVSAEWIETEADSLRFIQNTVLAPNAVEIGDDPEGGSYFLPVIVHQEDVDFEPEGPNGWMERTLVRVVGLGENVDADIFTGLVNDVETPLAPFSFSPTQHYFVEEQWPDGPRIFVLTIDDLPSGIDSMVPDNLLISDNLENELSHELNINGYESNKFIERDVFEDDFGTTAEIGEPPSDSLTLPVLLTYFQLLFEDTGLELLQYYANAGGGISIEDQWPWQEDWKFRYWTASDPYTFEIELDKYQDAVTAAHYLSEGLRKSLGYTEMRQELGFAGEDYEVWKTAMQVQAQEAAFITASAARIYISGLGIANEGLDLVLTINELSEGHWEAAIGFLPFVPASIGSGGKLLLKNTAGELIETFDMPVLQAIQEAATKKKFAQRWQALQNSGLTHQQAKRLVYSGFIRPNQSFRGLRNGMETIGDLPPAGMRKAQAHHELPWDMRDDFAEWGLDVNNPQYGHWVEAGLHQKWNVNNWNVQWREFLDGLDPDLPIEEGQQLILQHLDEVMRPQYFEPLPDGCPALWEHSGL